jgi:hypothetical protein
MKTLLLLAALASSIMAASVAAAPSAPPPSTPASTQDARKDAPTVPPGPHRIDDRRIQIRPGPKPESKPGPGIG